MHNQVTALFFLSNATGLLAHVSAISGFVTKLKGIHKPEFPFCKEDYHSHHMYYTQAAQIKVFKGPVRLPKSSYMPGLFFYYYLFPERKFYEYHCHLGFHKPNDFKVFISVVDFYIKIIS